MKAVFGANKCKVQILLQNRDFSKVSHKAVSEINNRLVLAFGMRPTML